MVQIGYAISSEEHKPNDILQHARRAEELGFTFSLISDHFHPWTHTQGQAPFVWSIIGGIAAVTERIKLGTGVTCPMVRTHPAIIAQAAATVATMMPGRFFLGVGTGEALNEHILGDHWPEHSIRVEMLEEAVEVIRLLWQGGNQSFYGAYYTVENAEIFTLPDEAPLIHVAASGPKMAEAAGRFGDGLISTAPDEEVIENFNEGGGKGKPRFGKMTICWAKTEAEGVKTAHKYWPTGGLGGELNQLLPTPTHFEQATKTVREEDIAEAFVCGPDVQKYVEEFQRYVKAGFDHVYIHQIGPDQEGFFKFYEKELGPALARKV